MALFGDSLCNGPMLNPSSQKATYKVMDKQRTNNNLLNWNGRQNLDSSWQTQLATNVGQSTSLQLISTEAAHAVLLGKANTKRDHLKSWLNKHWKQSSIYCLLKWVMQYKRKCIYGCLCITWARCMLYGYQPMAESYPCQYSVQQLDCIVYVYRQTKINK